MSFLPAKNVLVVAIFSALLTSVAWPTAAAGDRPNVVLIVSDYMGYRDTEPYGATDVRTPSIAELASDGVMFSNFYAAAPVCGPARAALYTGLYPARIGFERNIRTEADGLDSNVPTLARWLADAGYQTALFGKWHLGYRPEFSPGAHGYAEFLGHLHWTISYYSHVTDQGEPGLYRDGTIVKRDGYLTDILTDEAVSFIERNRDEPFFLTLAYNAALPPYQPPGLPAAAWDDGWDVNAASREDVVGMIERMDDGIGRVLETLDALDLGENTLVIYLYDHGGRHLVDSTPLFHGFANLFEGGIRVPAIIRFPGQVPAGAVFAEPAISMDLTATILHAAGLGGEATDLDGVDLLPALRGDGSLPDRQLYWQADHYEFGRQRAVRDGRYKYLEHGNTQFLFDLDADIGERHNLFAEQQPLLNRLRADLTRWQESTRRNEAAR
jgi:arylsulfatase A-like enzyme